MRRSVLTFKASSGGYATPARVGTASTNGANSTSWVTSFPQALTEGSMVTLAISASKGGAVSPDPGGLTGWTKVGSGGQVSGAASGMSFLYARARNIGDSWTAPTLTLAATTTLTWVMEEWSGLDLTVIPTGVAFTSSTNDSNDFAWTSHATIPEFGIAIAGARSSNSGVAAPTWTNATASYNTQVARNAYVFTATHMPAVNTAVTTTCAVVNTEATNVNTVGVGQFRRLAI